MNRISTFGPSRAEPRPPFPEHSFLAVSDIDDMFHPYWQAVTDIAGSLTEKTHGVFEGSYRLSTVVLP